jgi:hypothetical protein
MTVHDVFVASISIFSLLFFLSLTTYTHRSWQVICRCTGRSRSFVVINNACPTTDCARGVPITRMIFDRGDAQCRVLALVLLLVLVACVC